MRHVTNALAIAVAIALTCHVSAGGEDAKLLEGTWQVTELIVGGKKIPDKELAGMKFVFSKDKDDHKLTIVPPTADTDVVVKRMFKLKFDASKKPAAVIVTALDGEHKGATTPAIYELKGDVLRWCQSDDPKATEAPKEFTSPEKSSIYVFSFKRVKQ